MTTAQQRSLRHQLTLEGDGEETVPYDVEAVAEQVNVNDSIAESAAVVRAVGDAGQLHDACQEAEGEAETLTELRDVVEVVNEGETWSAESFTLLVLQLESISKRHGLNQIDIGVTLADLKANDGRVKVSVEEINKILDAIGASSADLEERSITALVELLNAIGDAVPKAYIRLRELLTEAETKNDRAGLQQVTFPDTRVKQRLVVNNEVPTPLSAYINEYCKYGDTLLTKYSEVSFQSVMKAGLFQTSVTELTFAGFWDGIDEKLKQISDPRCELTDGQKALTLPGAGPLFGPKQEIEGDALTVRDRLVRFATSNAPTSLSAFAVEVQVGEAETSMPALQPAEIRDCLRYLIDFGDTVNVKGVADNCKAAWVDASRTIHMVRDTLKSADESLLAALDGDDRLLPNYLSTLFTLSAWPVLNFLTNLVLFTNAFADYAAASLQAEVGEAPTDDAVPVEGSDSESTDDVVEVEEGAGELDGETTPEDGTDVPDTGETPDEPQDANGDGERAIVENVEETIQAEADDANDETADDSAQDIGADIGDDPSAVDVGAADETTDETTDDADVSGEEGESTETSEEEEEGDKEDEDK